MMTRTTLPAVALAMTAIVAAATPALAMRDPGAGAMPGSGMGLYDYANRVPSPPRIGQGGLSRQYADGMNLYQYVRSNPGRYLDPTGLWTSSDHETITSTAFPTAESFDPPMASEDRDWVVKELQRHNNNVDLWYLGSMRWHYNSPYRANRWNPNDEGARGRQARKDRQYDLRYWVNVQQRRARAAHYLREARKGGFWRGSNCRRSLEIIGNLDHAYQDFFMHAQRATSRHAGAGAGQKNTGADLNTKWGGFEVWTRGLHPTPENRTGVVPSSYSLWHNEAAHPGDKEPVAAGSAEYKVRKASAIRFQKSIYRSRGSREWSIQSWWKVCGCWAEQQR